MGMATQNNTDTFAQFKISYSKVYISAEEEAYRRAIFNVNEKIINEHNADKTQTYTKGINQFTDLTQEEFKSIYLGFKPREVKKVVEPTEEVSFIGDVNWVTRGDV